MKCNKDDTTGNRFVSEDGRKESKGARSRAVTKGINQTAR